MSSGLGTTFLGAAFSGTIEVTVAVALAAGFLLEAIGDADLLDFERSGAFVLAAGLPAFLAGAVPLASNGLGAAAAFAVAAGFAGLDLGIIGIH